MAVGGTNGCQKCQHSCCQYTAAAAAQCVKDKAEGTMAVDLLAGGRDDGVVLAVGCGWWLGQNQVGGIEKLTRRHTHAQWGAQGLIVGRI